MQSWDQVIEDEYVALIPIAKSHIDGLHQAGKDDSIWQWTTEAYCLTLENTEKWVETCLENAANGAQAPYVIWDKINAKIVGSTSYLNIELQHKAIEIGYTFVSTQSQRTHINRRCKLALLSHAFERLNVNRVAFQTHEKNQRSRNAILGLGARLDGILRHNRVLPNGSLRSSAIFSILKEEWPTTKAALIEKIRH